MVPVYELVQRTSKVKAQNGSYCKRTVVVVLVLMLVMPKPCKRNVDSLSTRLSPCEVVSTGVHLKQTKKDNLIKQFCCICLNTSISTIRCYFNDICIHNTVIGTETPCCPGWYICWPLAECSSKLASCFSTQRVVHESAVDCVMNLGTCSPWAAADSSCLIWLVAASRIL